MLELPLENGGSVLIQTREDKAMPMVRPFHFGQTTYLNYRNHRGEEAIRRFIPLRLEYGTTEHHPDKQWFLHAFDLDKKDYRTFALKDFVME